MRESVPMYPSDGRPRSPPPRAEASAGAVPCRIVLALSAANSSGLEMPPAYVLRGRDQQVEPRRAASPPDRALDGAGQHSGRRRTRRPVSSSPARRGARDRARCGRVAPAPADRREDRRRKALHGVRGLRPAGTFRALASSRCARPGSIGRAHATRPSRARRRAEAREARQVNGLDAVERGPASGQDDDVVPRRQLAGQPGDVGLGAAASLRRKRVRHECEAHSTCPKERTKSRSLSRTSGARTGRASRLRG